LRARGHRNIRATHDKTIELTSEPDITARATCVVGHVSATDLTALTGLRGSVTVTLRIGAVEDRITGVANPRYVGGSRAVIRRSDYRSPETFVTGADKAASGLNRQLVRALADPAAQMEIIVELGVDPPQRTAELLICPWRVVAALASAEPAAGDLSRANGWAVALRAASLIVGAGSGIEPAQRFGRMTGQRVATGAAGIAALIRPELERGAVTALVCEVEPAQADVAALVGEMVAAGWTVRAVGASATTAALVAAGLIGVPYADCGSPALGAGRRQRQVAALARASVVGLWSGRVEALVDLLGDVAAHHPTSPAALSVAIDDPDERHRRGTATELVVAAGELPAHRHAVAVVDLRTAEEPQAPAVETQDLLTALLAEGIAPTTLARALQRLPDVTRREGYDLILALKRKRER
jgi:16S rRNA C1402 (ribose-2'-O) methylase RsmI